MKEWSYIHRDLRINITLTYGFKTQGRDTNAEGCNISLEKWGTAAQMEGQSPTPSTLSMSMKIEESLEPQKGDQHYLKKQDPSLPNPQVFFTCGTTLLC